MSELKKLYLESKLPQILAKTALSLPVLEPPGVTDPPAAALSSPASGSCIDKIFCQICFTKLKKVTLIHKSCKQSCTKYL